MRDSLDFGHPDLRLEQIGGIASRRLGPHSFNAMAISLGLDIGAVSVKLAAIGHVCDSELLSALSDTSSFLTYSPTAGPFSGRCFVLSTYRRIQGNPVQAASDLLDDFCRGVPREKIGSIRVTGSGGRIVANVLNAEFENEFRALARSMRALYPQVRTVFEMGGETSKYLRLEPVDASDTLGIADYSASTDCAAGTGSFIDQQASRLLYSVEEVGEAACSATGPARVAGRCSVFAKTDMIHAQQKGYTTGQILRGLCEAVARNFKSSIVKGRLVVAPVAFTGAVTLNRGVYNALRDLFKLKEEDFIVPDLHLWMVALGAAMADAANSTVESRNRNIGPLPQNMKVANSFPSTDALSMGNVILLGKDIAPPSVPKFGEQVDAYLGIDIGSVSINLVVVDGFGHLLKEIYVPTAGRPVEVVTAGLREIESVLGPMLNVRGVGTTGSGRELIGELVGADTVNDEITAHKTGAMHVCRQLGMDPVDTIFEIGGQDSKFIRVKDGIVVDFTMNEACAAGTGSFLEEQAEKLGISIKGEFARLALSSKTPIRLGERCTVFMARDVSSLLLKGAAVPDLCAGLAYSVALNYLNRVVRGRSIGDVIYFQGGTAYNHAVAAAFSVVLGKPIIVPPHNGVIGAIGMALIARERMAASARRSNFRGYDLGRVDFTSRDFVCRACSNYCDMKEFVIEGEKSYWGDKCSDKFRKRSRTDREPVIEDLVECRDKLVEAPLKTANRGPTVGVPRAMFFFDRFPFWCTYLQELGLRVVVSAPTDGRTAAAGEELAIAQPCFPVQVAHGHVANLLKQGVDYVLLPNTVSAETPYLQVESKLCPWNQTLPFVLRAAQELQSPLQGKLLCPTVHFRQGGKIVRDEMRQLAGQLGQSDDASDRALKRAYTAQASFAKALKRTGERALNVLYWTHEPGIVLVGRPYNIYDRAVCCDIPRKLRTLYGINVVPLDFLPLDEENITAVNDNMYWNSGRMVLAAAQIARRHANLHLIYISNFKCGPDSYIKTFLDDASGKPSLVLQFDGHSNDAGYITRCEAYLDSKGFLRCNSDAIAV